MPNDKKDGIDYATAQDSQQAPQKFWSSGGLVPIPDPTSLTTVALKVAVENLKELLEAKIDCNRQLSEAVIKETAALNLKQFEEIHHQTEAIRREFQLQLDARGVLFNTQSHCTAEATNKAEASVNKQLEAMSKETAISRGALDEKIQALKERLDRGTGREDQQAVTRETSSWVVPMLTIGAIAVLGLILDIVQMLANHTVR